MDEEARIREMLLNALIDRICREALEEAVLASMKMNPEVQELERMYKL